jgi:hypothetical protein
VRLRQALLRGLRELRKWDLAPLGAVLIVLALGVSVFVFIATGGSSDNEEALVRSYFASPSGGGAPRDEVELMRVGDCQPTDNSVEGNVVLMCPVSYRGKRYEPCFAWSGDRVVAGSRDLGDLVGCDRIVWSRGVKTLVVA